MQAGDARRPLRVLAGDVRSRAGNARRPRRLLADVVRMSRQCMADNIVRRQCKMTNGFTKIFFSPQFI